MDKIKNRENSEVFMLFFMFMVIEWTTSDLLTTLILLNRAMRNCRIQSTNYIQKVNDLECI